MTGDGANDVPIMTITTDNTWLDPQPVLCTLGHASCSHGVYRIKAYQNGIEPIRSKKTDKARERLAGLGIAMKLLQISWEDERGLYSRSQSGLCSKTVWVIKPIPKPAFTMAPTDSTSATSMKCAGTMFFCLNAFSSLLRTPEEGSLHTTGKGCMSFRLSTDTDASGWVLGMTATISPVNHGCIS